MTPGRLIPALAAALLMAGLAAACSQPEEVKPISVTIKTATLTNKAGSQFVTVKAAGAWALSLQLEDGSAPGWVRIRFFSDAEGVTDLSGSGDASNIVLEYDANGTEEARSCELVLVSEGQRQVCAFEQDAGDVHPEPAKVLSPDPVGPWMELPATDRSDLYYFAHQMKVRGKTERCFEYYWDPANLVARWVAYPMNTGLIDDYTGSHAGRTDDWGLDPKLPQEFQPYIIERSYMNSWGNWSGFDRGHQCASADRLNVTDSQNANRKTFYGTNMTPQNSDFNGKMWATLEGKVRNWSAVMDTLYVVTGCVLDGSTTVVFDQEWKKITVPTGYFKALLGYAGVKHDPKDPGDPYYGKQAPMSRFGAYSSTGYYLGVAFYFENRSYGSDQNPLNHAMTIDELEQKTGFDFFVNLPGAIGADKAVQVESTVASWWKNN